MSIREKLGLVCFLLEARQNGLELVWCQKSHFFNLIGAKIGSLNKQETSTQPHSVLHYLNDQPTIGAWKLNLIRSNYYLIPFTILYMCTFEILSLSPPPTPLKPTMIVWGMLSRDSEEWSECRGCSEGLAHTLCLLVCIVLFPLLEVTLIMYVLIKHVISM